MREVKVLVPKGRSADVAQLALDAGARDATIREVAVFGSGELRDEVKVKTSTPVARRFIDAILAAPFFDRQYFEFSSHEIKSLVSNSEMAELTRPLTMPATDIFETLWQNSHLTQTFMAKVFGGALLLAYAMFQENSVLMVGALLFTPFTPLLMGIAFGMRAGDKHLVRQSVSAFIVGTLLTIFASFIVAVIVQQPLLYKDFGTVTSNFLFSAIAGLVAGFIDADDVGQRQAIALAATFPYVKFPVWLGISFWNGFPDSHTTKIRLLIFAVNIVTVTIMTWLVYTSLGIRRGKLDHFIPRKNAGV